MKSTNVRLVLIKFNWTSGEPSFKQSWHLFGEKYYIHCIFLTNPNYMLLLVEFVLVLIFVLVSTLLVRSLTAAYWFCPYMPTMWKR